MLPLLSSAAGLAVSAGGRIVGWLPEWAKFAAAALLGAALAFYPARWIGQGEGRQETELSAAKQALERINNLDEHNANFRKLSDRDRCRVFMRDSGLPVSACD